MAIGLLATGAIYSIWYSQWKTNTKIFAFILYGGPGVNKVHALNLGAVQLNVVQRVKIIRVIAKLAKIKESTKYTGALLYQIFKTYLPNEIKNCYRTYLRQYIVRASLINYGLNRKEEFTELELQMQDKQLFIQAKADFFMKMLNLYTGRGVQKTTLENSFAKAVIPPKPPVVSSAGKEVKPTTTPTQPGTPTETTKGTPEEGGETEGYY